MGSTSNIYWHNPSTLHDTPFPATCAPTPPPLPGPLVDEPEFIVPAFTTALDLAAQGPALPPHTTTNKELTAAKALLSPSKAANYAVTDMLPFVPTPHLPLQSPPLHIVTSPMPATPFLTQSSFPIAPSGTDWILQAIVAKLPLAPLAPSLHDVITAVCAALVPAPNNHPGSLSQSTTKPLNLWLTLRLSKLSSPPTRLSTSMTLTLVPALSGLLCDVVLSVVEDCLPCIAAMEATALEKVTTHHGYCLVLLFPHPQVYKWSSCVADPPSGAKCMQLGSHVPSPATLTLPPLGFDPSLLRPSLAVMIGTGWLASLLSHWSVLTTPLGGIPLQLVPPCWQSSTTWPMSCFVMSPPPSDTFVNPCTSSMCLTV